MAVAAFRLSAWPFAALRRYSFLSCIPGAENVYSCVSQDDRPMTRLVPGSPQIWCLLELLGSASGCVLVQCGLEKRSSSPQQDANEHRLL